MRHFLNAAQPLALAFRYRRCVLRRRARMTVAGQPPLDAQAWAQMAVVRELAAAWSRLLWHPPYFAASVLLSLAVGGLLAASAGLVLHGTWPLHVIGLGAATTRMVGVGLGVLATVALWSALARDWGPDVITTQSHAASQEALAASLDEHVRPPPLLLTLALLGLLVLDAVMAGTAILEFFTGSFTAAAAQTLATLWGLVVGGTLWKLTDAAADEARVASVRSMARRLDASNRASDRTRLERLMAAVGSRIGMDLSARRDVTWRAGLAATVLVLSVSTALLRGFAAPPEADAGPVPWSAEATTEAPGSAGAVGMPPAARARSAEPPAQGSDRWLPAVVMSVVLALSVAVLYWQKSKTRFIDLANGPRHAAVMVRFSDAASVRQFNLAHVQRVVASLDLRLQRLSLEVERAKAALPPSRQREWPPCQLRAIDLLRTSSIDTRSGYRDALEV